MKFLILFSVAVSLNASMLCARELSRPLFSYSKSPSGEEAGTRALHLVEKITPDFTWIMNAHAVFVYIPPEYRASAQKVLKTAIQKEQLEINLFPDPIATSE